VLPTGVHAGPGNPISPLPGELLLATPFVLLGSGAWQVFFWLGAYFYVAAALLRSHGVALLATWATVFLTPAAVHEIVTGGDLFANAMWVLVLGALVVSSRGTWKGALSAILFGVGLSSRVHFLLVVPVVFVVLAMRHGRATAVGRSYPSGVPSPEGASGYVTGGRGSRGHARAQQPGAMVCPSRRAVGVGRAGRIVLPPTGDPSLDVVLVAVETRRVAA
jgi:hypothetical protein